MEKFCWGSAQGSLDVQVVCGGVVVQVTGKVLLSRHDALRLGRALVSWAEDETPSDPVTTMRANPDAVMALAIFHAERGDTSLAEKVDGEVKRLVVKVGDPVESWAKSGALSLLVSEDGSETLQEGWRNLTTGSVEWRDVPRVVA